MAYGSLSTTVVCMALALLLGCQVGPRNFENENDRLREANLALERQVEKFSEQTQTRERELQAMHEANRSGNAMPEVEPVRFAGMKFGSYSGTIDNDGDGRDDLIRVYVQPLDQYDRFLPVAGKALIHAVVLPADGEPISLGRQNYEPAAWDKAYVWGMTSMYYTLELPLPDPPDGADDQLVVKVTVTEARTGKSLSKQQTVRVSW